MTAAASCRIAYFSMEVALESALPTYAGGLGALAGDTLRAAADMGLPMVGVTLLHRKGYFFQRLRDGGQTEEPVAWQPESRLRRVEPRVAVEVEGRKVGLAAWEHVVGGSRGPGVPVYLLDADLPDNEPWDRTLTDHLYGGDARYRLCQEVVLGIGGVRMLRALGFGALTRFHMNEGHASLLAVELLEELARAAGRAKITDEDVESVRRLCVFTTHTPVAAAHDRFPMELVQRVMGSRALYLRRDVFCCEGELNPTFLALNVSHYVNGVAKRHGEVAGATYAKHAIHSITNGVHPARWAAPAFAGLFDRRIPGWRDDNFSLRHALAIPGAEVWEAHAQAKAALLARVNRETNAGLSPGVFTLACARRATAYKRGDLLFDDLDRLRALAARTGGLQAVFAGKAHPRDEPGKAIIRRILEAAGRLAGAVRVAYLENYDLDLARAMTSGADLWLNTPQPPLEASGTSGMKAALNGVPSLSVLDGWWLEGHLEGVTGWSIGEQAPAPGGDRGADARSLYEKLDRVILPLYYGHRGRYLDVMRHAIALNGSFFNTQRMLQQYAVNAYLL
ncbi:MAG: alpha-glucan family phosphorylase [Elusimicrobia bacterium]|nr:alpha-glucan family phosphorylase [Elusimicrobiota bacterium]